MSFVMGKEAALREADIASERATDVAEKAMMNTNDDTRASLALLSLAHSARELCWLARAVAAHFIKSEK